MSLVPLLFLKSIGTMHLRGVQREKMVNGRLLPLTAPAVVLQMVKSCLFLSGVRERRSCRPEGQVRKHHKVKQEN